MCGQVNKKGREVKMRNKKKQIGFSMVELLVCMGIILVLIAIAIPNYVRAKMLSNETSAVSSITAINVAESMYVVTCPLLGYSAGLTQLGPGTGTCAGLGVLPDTALQGGGIRSGFTFTYVAGPTSPITTYTVSASPVTQGVTGTRGFFSDQTQMIHYNATGTASAGDPILQ
jgi:type IV pilus assembly protein PilA